MNLRVLDAEGWNELFKSSPYREKMRKRSIAKLYDGLADDDTFEALADEESDWDGTERALPLEDFGGLMGWSGD